MRPMYVVAWDIDAIAADLRDAKRYHIVSNHVPVGVDVEYLRHHSTKRAIRLDFPVQDFAPISRFSHSSQHRHFTCRGGPLPVPTGHLTCGNPSSGPHSGQTMSSPAVYHVAVSSIAVVAVASAASAGFTACSPASTTTVA